MIEEMGRVISVDGELAWVSTQRLRACGHCAEQGGCGTALVAQMRSQKSVRIRARNPIQARPGEQVVLGVEEGAFLRATALLYGIPLLTLIGGSLAGQWVEWRTGAMEMELLSLIGGLLGLGGGIGWVRHRTRKSDLSAFQVVILRRSEEPSVSVPLSEFSV